MTTHYKLALDEFLDSAEGKANRDPSSLGAPMRMQQYLENRLARAFEGGWNAREASSATGDA